MNTQWNNELWDMLCELWKLWGGDCKDLPPKYNAPALVAFMNNVLQTQGPPDVSGPGELERLLKLLNDLEDHLKDPDNDLAPVTTQAFENWIVAVRNAVKP